MPEIIARPLPKGVTDPKAVLTRRTVHLILTGQMKPNENVIHALARDWMQAHIPLGPQPDDL